MFESIILIGPGTDLFPLVNKNLRNSHLPVLNKELLLHNIEFLLPISCKIYIVILEEDVDITKKIVESLEAPIEIIGIPYYDGTVSVLLKLQNRIIGENIVVTKGDLITNIDIRQIANEFLIYNNLFLTILSRSANDNTTIGYDDDNLLFYTNELSYVFPKDFFLRSPINLTKKLDTVQFYVFKKEVFRLFSDTLFCFKSNLLPILVEELRNINPVRIFNPHNSYIYQVKNIDIYRKVNTLLKFKLPYEENTFANKISDQKIIKQYIKKNDLKDFKNIIGKPFKGSNLLILNSIIGNNCNIGSECKILSSIVMNNVTIGKNCYIEKSTIGVNVTIPDNTKLINCVISPGFIFNAPVCSKNETFSCN